MSSLRSKILTSYGLSKAALLIFVAVVVADLHYLETHIIDGEAVDSLYAASLKIRNSEKNLFLNNDPVDLVHLRDQIVVAQDALTQGEKVLTSLSGPDVRTQLAQTLESYSALLDDYINLSPEARPDKQKELRSTGQQLSQLTQYVDQRQREILSKTTELAARTLIAASVTVILLGVISAMYMVRRVVRPLTLFENQLLQLANGRVQALTLPSNDKEIESFVFHFNAMLEQLREQQNQLRRHERAAALGVLVSGVAHELNNPLSNISTSVQLLQEDDGSTRLELRKQWLTHIDGEAERAKRIVRRLLDTVRQPTPHTQQYDAAELVQAAVMLIHRQLPKLLLHIEDIESATLLVDTDRMRQVFINLILNAAQAGAGNICITGKVTTWEASRPDSSQHLSGDTENIARQPQIMLMQIDDDGPGVPEEDLQKIFDPFFTTQTGGEGTGLGLYLVEEIINEHRGCISVENHAKGGARFLLWLPLVSEQSVATEEK